MSDTSYGFIGLGNMGAPMCANLCAAGFAPVAKGPTLGRLGPVGVPGTQVDTETVAQQTIKAAEALIETALAAATR